MIEKHGDVTPDSHSDFDTREKVKYADGLHVAGEGDKEQLKHPIKIAFHPQRGCDIITALHKK